MTTAFPASIALLMTAGSASAALLGPTPYLQAADSPFASQAFDWFHLEDFESHTLSTPGVSADHGGVTSVLFGPGPGIDSVDADDGIIDGSGADGDSWFYGVGATGVTWTFDAGVLGNLPTHVGIVWTDGERLHQIRFEAWDAAGNSLGVQTGIHADLDGFSGTAEDRFYGVEHAAGISAIRLSNPDLYIEMDHLQYGYRAVPAPMSAAGMVIGLGLVGGNRRRR